MSGSRSGICVDIDNVIAQTDEVMRRVIQEYTRGRVQLSYEDIKHFNYYECTDKNGNGISKEDWKPVHDLFSEPLYLSDIRPFSGAIEGLHVLARETKLHIATSRLRKARRTTVEWLDKFGIPDHDLHFVKHNEKHFALGSFIAAVEDDYEQAVEFAKRNITCFLMEHPWNESKRKIEGIHWVDTWPDLTERLLAMIPAA